MSDSLIILAVQHETKESLREQLSDMMSGISNLSDRFKGHTRFILYASPDQSGSGIDPIQRNAQATLLASQSQNLAGGETESSIAEVFDAIDVNKDGVIDSSEFRKAYSQASSMMSLGASLGTHNTNHENILSNSRISQAAGTPPLPTRPTKTTNVCMVS